MSQSYQIVVFIDRRDIPTPGKYKRIFLYTLVTAILRPLVMKSLWESRILICEIIFLLSISKLLFRRKILNVFVYENCQPLKLKCVLIFFRGTQKFSETLLNFNSSIFRWWFFQSIEKPKIRLKTQEYSSIITYDEIFPLLYHEFNDRMWKYNSICFETTSWDETYQSKILNGIFKFSNMVLWRHSW